MTSFSKRSSFAPQPNRLTAAIALRHEALLDLTESNPTHAGLSPTHEELAPLFADPRVDRYEPEPLGLLSARRAVADQLGREGIEAEHVLLTASTSEAYGDLFKLLCDPGDAVLVPTPSYPLFDVLAQLEGVALRPYQLVYDGTWHVDLASVRDAIDERVKAILVVHPNNPTGSFLKRDELLALAALGLPIVSDEVFSDYALRDDQDRAISALDVCDQALVFRMSGLSKAAALPQMKLAWTVVAGPGAEEARARLEHVADAYLSPSAPVQLALPALLTGAHVTQARIRDRVRENLATLHDCFAGSAANVLDVEGGWYAIVRLPALLDDESWALSFLEQDGVLTQPGYYYELARGVHVVVSLLCAPARLREGATRIAARVAAVCR